MNIDPDGTWSWKKFWKGLGISDYANMVKVDGAGVLSRSVVALMSKIYTMGPTIATGVTRGITKFVGNYIGDWI